MGVSIWNRGGLGYSPTAKLIPYGAAGGGALTENADLSWDNATKALLLGFGGVNKGNLQADASNISFNSANGVRLNLLTVGIARMDFWTNSVRRLIIQDTGSVDLQSARLNLAKGADAASAGTLTLVDGNLFHVTGTTTINYLTTTLWTAGCRIRLILKGAITITHNAGSVPANTAAFKLAGAANLVGADGDIVDLTYDGTVWRGGRIAATGA